MDASIVIFLPSKINTLCPRQRHTAKASFKSSYANDDRRYRAEMKCNLNIMIKMSAVFDLKIITYKDGSSGFNSIFA